MFRDLLSLLLWLNALRHLIKLLWKMQQYRNEHFQRTGYYPEMRLNINDETVVYWPRGKKYPGTLPPHKNQGLR